MFLNSWVDTFILCKIQVQIHVGTRFIIKWSFRFPFLWSLFGFACYQSLFSSRAAIVCDLVCTPKRRSWEDEWKLKSSLALLPKPCTQVQAMSLQTKVHLLVCLVMSSVPQTRCLQVWLCPVGGISFSFIHPEGASILIYTKELFRFIGALPCSPPNTSTPGESCPKEAGTQACFTQPGKWGEGQVEAEAMPCPAFVMKNPSKGPGEGKNTEKKPERHDWLS